MENLFYLQTWEMFIDNNPCNANTSTQWVLISYQAKQSTTEQFVASGYTAMSDLLCFYSCFNGTVPECFELGKKKEAN